MRTRTRTRTYTQTRTTEVTTIALCTSCRRAKNCDLIGFKMNFPAASHMGGAWERQIRSVRNVLSSLLLKHGEQLNDESLRTFLHESAAVVNSRPLSVDNVNDPLSVTP